MLSVIQGGNGGGLTIPATHEITYPENAVLSEDHKRLLLTEGDDWRVKHVIILNKGFKTVNLSKLTGNFVATDRMRLTGTLGGFYKVSIADGAKVMLSDATIDIDPSGYDFSWYQNYHWAGITCQGDATIILQGSNAVRGFSHDLPGIYVPEGKTLTIDGNGALDVTCGGNPEEFAYPPSAPGIGAGMCSTCGNIVITKQHPMSVHR